MVVQFSNANTLTILKAIEMLSEKERENGCASGSAMIDECCEPGCYRS
jgi:hypothetical protein